MYRNMALVYLSLRTLKLAISEIKNKKLTLHFFQQNSQQKYMKFFIFQACEIKKQELCPVEFVIRQ